MNPIDMLASIQSTGRRMPRVLKNPETDGVIITDPPSRPCPGCGHVTVDGDSITKVFYVWWHTKCAQQYLESEGQNEAWRVLGAQLAAHPRAFNTATTRAIVENLLRMAGGAS